MRIGTPATQHSPPAGGRATPGGNTDAARNRWWRLRVRARQQPRLIAELALVAVAYGAYSLIRDAVPNQQGLAFAHAHAITHLEVMLGINAEHAINHAANRVGPLIVGMNYYYATLHFVITIAVLLWVYRRRPHYYRLARTTVFATTALALIGFYAYPLAPPRLLPGAGFIDTVVVHHTWGAMASGDLAKMSNQYAAMPSMHIGWSLWCAFTVYFLTDRKVVKRMVFAYPLFTLVVIIATANHFFLDAAGGALTLTAGALLALLVHGRVRPAAPNDAHERDVQRIPEPSR